MSILNPSNPASSGDFDPIPAGVIVIWSGSADDIPAGWHLCDGNNGTPDLRDRFILGAGDVHTVGDIGGEEEVMLTVEQMPSHQHRYLAPYSSGIKTTTSTSSSAVTFVNTTSYYSTDNMGSSQAHNNMPPYYALCYIIKL